MANKLINIAERFMVRSSDWNTERITPKGSTGTPISNAKSSALQLTLGHSTARLLPLGEAMKRLVLTLALACAVLASGAEKKEAGTMPKIGDLAPDFKMQYFDGHELKDVTLAQYRGQKQVVLAFY